MNYLAHAYLSFHQPPVLAGNMLSDFVKGKKQYDFPAAVQVGIKLHRAIDNFTDTHAATRLLTDYFRPDYRLFSGPLVDIVYDYFLANDPLSFESEAALQSFAADTYDTLENYAPVFPENFASIFPYMRQYNWLLNYRQVTGIERSFYGLTRRSSWINDTALAFRIFLENKQEMEKHYMEFFPDVKLFAARTLAELLKH